MKNVPDELLPALRGAVNELPDPGPNRWGKAALLHLSALNNEAPRKSLTFIATGALRQITPMAVSLKFSVDGKTFTPDVPLAYTGEVQVEIIQMVDVKSGAFRESFELVGGETQPFCSVMCMALQVTVSITADDNGQFLYVHAVAAPTQTMDCRDIIGPDSGGETTAKPEPIPSTVITRYEASTTPITLAADELRAYFLMTNQSTLANLFIALGPGVSTTPGGESATIVLPPNSFAGYEIALPYTGEISFAWDDDDAEGYGLVTRGLYAA
jgi:hypothetical protein